MQLLAAQQLDETKLVTATLCQSFQVSERGLALRQECLALAKQEGLLEAQLERQNNTCNLLQEDLAFAWTKHRERKERSAEFPEVKDVKLMELRELELVSGNLQLESADLLVSEQESIAEARSLEQDTWNLQKQISLLKRKAEQHYGRAEHLSSSLSLLTGVFGMFLFLFCVNSLILLFCTHVMITYDIWKSSAWYTWIFGDLT